MIVLEIREVMNTKKAWQCDGCLRKFEAGTPKQRQRLVDGRDAYTIEWCQTCAWLAKDLFASDSSFWDEGVSDDDLFESMMDRFGSWEAADDALAQANAKEAELAILESSAEVPE